MLRNDKSCIEPIYAKLAGFHLTHMHVMVSGQIPSPFCLPLIFPFLFLASSFLC
jgi:hypothetical protein